MTRTAFKEWKLVADALGRGRQILLLRKGGIHEGKGGFAFQHDHFWIFPTWFHAQAQALREVNTLPEPPADVDEMVEICLHARIVFRIGLTRWELVKPLAPFHIWAESIVRERFEQDGNQCLHAAVVRISKLEVPWRFPMEKRFGGCRSWIEVPPPPDDLRFHPVLPAQRQEELEMKIKRLLVAPDPELDQPA